MRAERRIFAVWLARSNLRAGTHIGPVLHVGQSAFAVMTASPERGEFGYGGGIASAYAVSSATTSGRVGT